MAFPHRIDPRIRAYGKARIDITRRASDEHEWQRQWKDPRYPFPFTWTDSWKQAIEYRVDDFAAEVGFMMDVLGFPAQTFSPSFATFTSPGLDFSFSVAANPEGALSTPPDAFRLQFMIADIEKTVAELERRGVVFERRPDAKAAGPGGLACGYFRTPHGICIDLIGYTDCSDEPAPASSPAAPAWAAPPPPPKGAAVFNLEPEAEPESEPEPEPESEELPLFASDLDILAEHARFALGETRQEEKQPKEVDREEVIPADFGLDEPKPAVVETPQPPPSRPRPTPPTQPSRLDPFRASSQGRFPSGSPRLRSSSHARGIRPGNKERHGNGSIKGATLRPTPDDRRDLPRPPGSRPVVPTSPPDPPPSEPQPEDEPEKELKYEDIDSGEDFEPPY